MNILSIILNLELFSYSTNAFDMCAIDNNSKEDCMPESVSTINEENCNSLGCCYEDLGDDFSHPWCYYPIILTTIPTTILTTIPTTILTTIPTTILTTLPTTILTTIPTTILTTLPTTILTTLPTTILTTLPTTILTNLPTTILTTLPIITTITTSKESENTNILESTNIIDYFEQIKKNDIIINNIIDLITNNSNSMLNYIKEEKKDKISKTDNMTCQITSSDNQNNNDYENISTIDLGICEEKLKYTYNISKNDTIIILKIEYYLSNYSIPIIEYQFFHPNEYYILELNTCENITININIPVDINEKDLYKYDPNNKFYTDRCHPYTTESGTDITLYDRKNEYNNNNLSLCEKNCEFNGYNKTTKKVLCQCNTKSKFSLFSEELHKAKDGLLNNFIDIDKNTNLFVIKCYKTFFRKSGIITNIGSYILMCIIFIHIIGLIIFYYKGFPSLKMKIKEIIDKKKENVSNINNTLKEKETKQKLENNITNKNNNPAKKKGRIKRRKQK